MKSNTTDKLQAEVDMLNNQVIHLTSTLSKFIEIYHKDMSKVVERMGTVELLLPQGDENEKTA
jgi:hypothetical protein